MDDRNQWPKQYHEGEGNNSAGFVTPYKLGSGVMRGTQIIQNSDSSKITLGQLPDNSQQFGIAFIDSSGRTIKTDTGVTQTVYDASGIPTVLIGKLPDGSYGIAVGKPGIDVTTAFS